MVLHASIEQSKAPSGLTSFEHVMRAREALLPLIRSIACQEAKGTSAFTSLSSGTSHLWCSWLAPSGNGSALLLNGSWNLSAFALCGWYRSVVVLDFDPQRASCFGEVAKALKLPLTVKVVDPTDVEQLLFAHAARGPELVALQDVFDPFPLENVKARAEFVQALVRSLPDTGQLAVISEGRYRLSKRRLQRLGGRPTPQNWRNTSATFSHAEANWLFFHPNHHAATELMQGEWPLPTSRRGDWRGQILSRLGAMEALLGAYAVITPRRVGKRILDRWLHAVAPNARDDKVLRNLDIRDQEMMFLRIENGPHDSWMLRAPLDRSALQALHRADAAMDAARKISGVDALVPHRKPLESGSGWPVSLERLCVGVPARRYIEAESTRIAVRRQVEAIADAFVAATARIVKVDVAMFDEHWGRRLDAMLTTHESSRNDLESMRELLRRQLIGQEVPLVRIHGDFTPNNLFVSPETLRASGLIDWEASVPDSLPLDTIHYLVNELREREGTPWGHCVARFMTGEGVDVDASAMLSRTLTKLRVDASLFRPLLAGYWLRGVALRQLLSGGALKPAWRDANFLEPLKIMKPLGAA